MRDLDIRNETVDLISQARVILGMSQAEIADRFGVSHTLISTFMRNRTMGIQTVLKIRDYLKAALDKVSPDGPQKTETVSERRLLQARELRTLVDRLESPLFEDDVVSVDVKRDMMQFIQRWFT